MTKQLKFITGNIESFELEDFLATILNSEFDTIPDDGSLPQVCIM